MTKAIIEKTMEYLSVPSVVGYEQSFLEYLERDFRALGLSIYKSPRYLAVSGKTPHAATVCAHIDRHGLISLGHGEYVYAAQYIKEIKYGENNRLARQQLENIAKRFEGEQVYACDPVTGRRIAAGIIETCNPDTLDGDALFHIEGMYQDVEPGIPVAYARTGRFEEGYFKGQIDNAISLGTVYALFQNGFEGTALLTTEEEIGKSWMHIKAHLELEDAKTSGLIILDTSPYTDQQTIENGDVILRSRDMSGIFNTDLVKALKGRAADLGLSYQVKDESMLAAGKRVEQLGSTELGRLVQKTEGRWNGATVQIPTLMYHTSNETTTAHAIENYFSFLHSILIESPIEGIACNQGETIYAA